MAESDSFSLLKALAASHLSKTCIQNDDAESNNGFPRRIPVPSLNGIQKGSSDTRLSFTPGRLPGLPLPPFSLSESPIRSVLEEQLMNRFKAQEQKRIEEEENARLAESMKKLKVEEDFEIDLRMAIEDGIRARQLGQIPAKPVEEVLSSSSSFESLFEPKFINCDDEQEAMKVTQEPLLPCVTDMSYILKQKVKRGKCSAFGKVLTSRLKRVAAPYLREHIDSKIKPFDFKTKSPCDLIKEKLRKPTVSSVHTFDITTFI
ncbi:uncharacterized protein LOC106129532 [Amyelois transitella]|uniref:uncharacterized protein LOC106129532 n=1 Tax=Amyelois transitella TaxID=680683 RepID=UPI00067C0F7F|nr:uncharacterized protein LOC106129532 [Amyelois transitella]